jgi:dolichyl-phosphate beta-glucosyltransferase
MTDPWLSVVIPAYNEAGRIQSTLDELLAYFRVMGKSFEVLVVDDGSRDRTAEEVERKSEPEVRVLRLARNKGKGAAVKRGVAVSRGEIVLLNDADSAFPIEQFERFRDRLDNGCDIAVGSRELPESSALTRLPFHRKRMGQTFNWLVRSMGLSHLKDTQCGFKLCRGSVVREVFSHCHINRFAFDVEWLYVARRLGYRVDEVPIAWRHVPVSRVHPVYDAARMLADIIRIRLRSWVGAYPVKARSRAAS